MQFKPIYFFILICTGFLVYSFSIYMYPPTSMNGLTNDEMTNAAEGKMVFQKYNCQSCHQIYNLGGYLGPDLTNCYSQEGKGELYIKAMVQSGTNQMPAFRLSEIEINALLQFFKAIDKTGSSDLRKFHIEPNGMIESNGK